MLSTTTPDSTTGNGHSPVGVRFLRAAGYCFTHIQHEWRYPLRLQKSLRFSSRQSRSPAPADHGGRASAFRLRRGFFFAGRHRRTRVFDRFDRRLVAELLITRERMGAFDDEFELIAG